MFFCHLVCISKVAEEYFAFLTKANLNVVSSTACATEEGGGPNSDGVGRVSAQFDFVSEVMDDMYVFCKRVAICLPVMYFISPLGFLKTPSGSSAARPRRMER